MQNVIKLSQDDLINAIGLFLEGQGASGDLSTVSFAFDGSGEVLATLERALDDDEVEADGFDHATVALAKAQREAVDSFSGQKIPKGSPCLWIQDVGITVVHPVEWPKEAKKKYPFTRGQLTYLSRKLGKSGAPKASSTEASTAADILGGGDAGPLDRSSALGDGLNK